VAANALLSFFPFVLLLMTLIRRVFHSPVMYDVVRQLLRDFLPAGQDFVIRNLNALVEARHRAQVVSLLILLVTSTGIFLPLEVALNRIWRFPNNRSYLGNQLIALGLSFSCGVLALLSIALTAGNIGFLTDLGHATKLVIERVRAANVLLLETNHDLRLLQADTKRPWSVKQRVMSRVGHLSNEAAAEFLERNYDGQAAYVILAHLSESNNLPALARVSAERALCDRMSLLANKLLLAEQDQPLAAISRVSAASFVSKSRDAPQRADRRETSNRSAAPDERHRRNHRLRLSGGISLPHQHAAVPLVSPG